MNLLISRQALLLVGYSFCYKQHNVGTVSAHTHTPHPAAKQTQNTDQSKETEPKCDVAVEAASNKQEKISDVAEK